MQVASSHLFNNSASDKGGGIFMDTSGDLRLQNTTLIENKSGRNGGGISAGDGTVLNVVESSFIANNAQTNQRVTIGEKQRI